MAKRNRETTPDTVARRIAEGRGKGHGREYQPWLRVQDVPSRGLSSRILGWRTGRDHHLLSLLETRHFYTLEWSAVVVDVREQFPLLPLEKTQEIAEECGYRHPTDPKTQEPVVMTTDFLVDVERGASREVHARTVKYFQSCTTPQKDKRPLEPLTSQRTLEKLEIERLYWKQNNIPWAIVTDREIPKNLADNVQWLHPCRDLAFDNDLNPLLVQQVAKVLTPQVQAGKTGLSALTSDCDQFLGLNASTSLKVARHLLATGGWRTDMSRLIMPSDKLILLGENVTTEQDAAHKYGLAHQHAA